MTDLTAPLTLPCGAILPNRIAKSGMSEQLATRDGRPTDRLARLYSVWGSSGAGLLITGNAMIDRRALTEPGNVILDDDRAIDALRTWARAGQSGAAKVWMQLSHPGRAALVPLNKWPVAPSRKPIPVPGYNLRPPHPLTHAEIADIVSAFAAASRRAQQAGFDGVQIHLAHGFLLSQFLSPAANVRTDKYGGSPENRRRIVLEVIDAVRDAVGPEFPIGVKLNSSDFSRQGLQPEEALDVAVALEAVGVDLIEISGGGFDSPAMTGVASGQVRSAEAYFAEFATLVRQQVSTPLMLTGGIRTKATMQRLVDDRTVDVIGLARPMAFVPDYPRRILAGEDVSLPANAPRLGYRPLDGYLDLAWHGNQFHRIARGRTPQLHPGPHTLVTALTRISKSVASQAVVPR